MYVCVCSAEESLSVRVGWFFWGASAFSGSCNAAESRTMMQWQQVGLLALGFFDKGIEIGQTCFAKFWSKCAVSLSFKNDKVRTNENGIKFCTDLTLYPQKMLDCFQCYFFESADQFIIKKLSSFEMNYKILFQTWTRDFLPMFNILLF